MRSTIPETGITAHPMLFCVVRAHARARVDWARHGDDGAALFGPVCVLSGAATQTVRAISRMLFFGECIALQVEALH